MKRTIAILLAVLTSAALLTGCSGTDTNVSTTPNGTVNGTENNAKPDRTPSGSNTDTQPEVPNQDRESAGSVPNTDNGTGENNSSTTPDQNGSSFEQDMTDAADDALDGMKDAVEDVTGSRAASRSGRGMVGGR